MSGEPIAERDWMEDDPSRALVDCKRCHSRHYQGDGCRPAESVECPHGESGSRNCPECYDIEVEEHERRWMEEGV